MHLKVFTFNAFQENTYLLWNAKKEVIIIDPGNSDDYENRDLDNFIVENNLLPIDLLLTHAHIDHILGAAYVCNKYGLKPKLYFEDAYTFSLAQLSADKWQIPYSSCPEPTYLNNLDDLVYADLTLKLRFVPGHSKGHIIFICDEVKKVIVGDTIFNGSIGRTDLPGGNHDELLTKIKSEIFTLPKDYELYPGHGPKTTVGYEIDNNPFF